MQQRVEVVGFAVVMLLMCSSSAYALADTPVKTIAGSEVANAVRSMLGDMARYNWEAVRIEKIDVSSGDIDVFASRGGDGRISMRLRGKAPVVINARGKGIDNDALHVSFRSASLNARVDLVNRVAEFDLPITLQVHPDGCARIYTKKICDIPTSPFSKATVRAWVRPKAMAVSFTLRFRAEIDAQGTLSLVIVRYTAKKGAKIDADVPIRHAPDGRAVIPLAQNERIEIKLDVLGHTFVWRRTNPLADVISRLVGRRIVLGKINL
jgi:hypothetical protein